MQTRVIYFHNESQKYQVRKCIFKLPAKSIYIYKCNGFVISNICVLKFNMIEIRIYRKDIANLYLTSTFQLSRQHNT